MYAVQQYTQAALRDTMGTMELDQVLIERDKIAQDIRNIVDKETSEWGIDIQGIKIQEIENNDFTQISPLWIEHTKLHLQFHEIYGKKKNAVELWYRSASKNLGSTYRCFVAKNQKEEVFMACSRFKSGP